MGRQTDSKNNLESRFPEISKEWDFNKNTLSPRQVFPGAVAKYWWICPNGHSYFSSPNKRTSANRGCPYCSGRLVSDKNSLVKHFPLIAKEFNVEKNANLDVKELTIKSHKNIWWKCKKGHEWQAIISNRTRGNNCPFCHSQVSKNELRVYSELKHFFNNIRLKKKVNGFECDILISDLKVAIEYDGVYWHKNKINLDKKKNIGLSDSEIKLIRIREIGLQKISEIDIIYDFNKQSILLAIKEVLRILINLNLIEDKITESINEYIKGCNFINEREYRDLLERLPSPIFEESLEFKFPNLLNEWNYIRNKGLAPSDVSSKSALKVWWTCKEGHEWESSIGNRTQGGNNCPYCAHQIISTENSLSYKRSDLVEEWNTEKNRGVNPEQVFAYTTKKYWWKCANGHEWLASPSNRASTGKGKNTGCPFCSNKKVNFENSLAKTNIELTKEWNYKKNGDLKPTLVTKGSEKKVWWICSKNHEWEATIASRNRGNGCPYCSNQKVCKESSLYTNQPDLIKEWNYEKNNGLSPHDFTEKSGKKVWWKCQKGHEWETSVVQRANLKSGCPYCSGFRTTKENSLQTNYPEIAKEWNYNKNEKLTPNDVTKKSAKSVWWMCKNGHEWTAKVKDRVAGRYKCKECKKTNA
ncbi:MAG: zinc-ribbon domain-containing protein [Bacteroidales bacterium]